MKRKRHIMVNCIKCNECGEILNSKYRHDFVSCKCFKESNGTKGCACDGGLSYLRRVGEYGTWEDLSVTVPYTDEERDQYNEQQLLLAEQYGTMFTIDLME